MNSIRKMVVPLVACLALCVWGCESNKSHDHRHAHDDAKPVPAAVGDIGKTAVAIVKPSTAATTQPTMNNVTGTVTFTQLAEGVAVVAEIQGLTPNTLHGFHIHEKGDLSAPDLSSAGAHYNPLGLHHGGAPPKPDEMTIMQRHVGDLGNIKSDASGKAHLEVMLPSCSLGGENSIVGRSVIVHAKEDDLKTDPSGNSGGRVAGGVIETKK